MGANTKTLKTRIKSVDSTLHLTKAMGLVASLKIRRATEAMNKSREYAAAVDEIVKLLVYCNECKRSPYMKSIDDKESKTKLIVVAGDRGLAGGHNANIFRFMRDLGLSDANIFPIGKKAAERYGKNTEISSEKFSFKHAEQMAAELCEEFLNGEFERLGIVSTRYVSMMTQQPVITWILPLTQVSKVGEQQIENSQKELVDKSVLFEPDEESVLKRAVPEYVSGMIFKAVKESFACETVSRRMAMDAASKNAQQMIDELLLDYNRARQSAITQEITEIVAGSGA